MTSVKTLHAGCTGKPLAFTIHSLEKAGGERLVLLGLCVEAATALTLQTGGAKLRSTFIHFGGLLGSDDDEKALRDELRAADVLLLTGREAIRAIKELNDPLLRLAPKAALGWLLHPPDVVGEFCSRNFNYVHVSEAARKHLKIPEDLDLVGFWLRQFGNEVETAVVNPEQGGLLWSPHHWEIIPRPRASALDEALFEQAFAAGYMNSRFLDRNCIPKAVWDAVATAVQASRRA